MVKTTKQNFSNHTGSNLNPQIQKPTTLTNTKKQITTQQEVENEAMSIKHIDNTKVKFSSNNYTNETKQGVATHGYSPNVKKKDGKYVWYKVHTV